MYPKFIPRQRFPEEHFRHDRRVKRGRVRRMARLHDKTLDLMTTHGVFSAKWRRVARRYYRIVLHEQMQNPLWDVVKATRRRSRI